MTINLFPESAPVRDIEPSKAVSIRPSLYRPESIPYTIGILLPCTIEPSNGSCSDIRRIHHCAFMVPKHIRKKIRYLQEKEQ